MSGGLTFPHDWPEPCPPADANAADTVIYRRVLNNPPLPADFLSYRELGKRVSPGKACQACGLSVFVTREDAVHNRELFPSAGQFIAAGRLLPCHGKTMHTPSGTQPAHYTWWCYDGVARSTLFKVI